MTVSRKIAVEPTNEKVDNCTYQNFTRLVNLTRVIYFPTFRKLPLSTRDYVMYYFYAAVACP